MLVSSQTLFNTIRKALTLHSVGLAFTSIPLVTIWAFSPSGGQAVLRSMTLQRDFIEEPYQLIYFPQNNLSVTQNSGWTGASSSGDIRTAVRTLFGAALSPPNAAVLFSNGSSPSFEDAVTRLGGPLEAIRISKRDAWSNVRVPFIHMLPGYDLSRPFDWMNVTAHALVPYESLIGIPLRGLPLSGEGSMNFVLQASYHTLSVSVEPGPTASKSATDTYCGSAHNGRT